MKELACFKCATVFGISDSVYVARKKDGELFSCPNGHEQYFTHKETLEKKLADMTTYRNNCKESANHYEKLFSYKERSVRALRGVITRMKNRMFKQCPRCGCKAGVK